MRVRLMAPPDTLDSIEPAAGPTPRRDPLDLPLREEERWREWLLDVEINGHRVEEGAYVIRDPVSGRFAVRVEDARRWRIPVSRENILTFQGQPFYPLDAIRGATVAFDAAELRLRLQVPAEELEPYRRSLARKERPQPRTDRGLFVDYDLLYTASDAVENRLDGLVEFGFFARLGVLDTSLQLDDLVDGLSARRLETTFTHDFPDLRTSLRLGDSLTEGGTFARPVRFAGIQYGTNFALDPGFITFPLPAIGGLAEQDSVVEVFVDNLQRATARVPPGPFSFDNVPVLTGAGEIQLKVTDLLGRERLITQSYYVSSRLLRRGLHDFSYAAGVLRESFAEDSFEYGDAMLSATHRYGFSDAATGDVHLELSRDRQQAAAGGTLRLGNLGVATAGLGASHDRDVGEGGLMQLAYEYVSRKFSVGLRTRYAGRHFRALGEDSSGKRIDQLNLGLELGGYGHLGLLLVNRVQREERDARSLAANYSLRIGPGSLNLNLAHVIEPGDDYAFSVSYSVPLSHARSLSAFADGNSERARGRLQFRQSRGATDIGLDYRLAGELGDQPRYLDSRAEYQGRYGAVNGALEARDGSYGLRLGATGSLVWMKRHLLASRRIGRAFGLVSVPGFPHVRVYLENRLVGRTDEDGLLVVPGLRPYESNRLRLELDDLPLGATIKRGEVEAVPYSRSGILIPFEVSAEGQATAILRDGRGEPLPPGLELASDDGGVHALIGRGGFARIHGTPAEHPIELRGRLGSKLYLCRLSRFEPAELLADLGERTCSVE